MPDENNNIFSDFIIEDPPEVKEVQTDLIGFDLPILSTSGKEKIEENKNSGDKNKSRSLDSGSKETELEKKSREAGLKKSVHDQEIKSIKLEREKIGLLKDAGEVGELSFFDFCYVAYMEKMNIDLFKMINRIEPRILTLVSENKGSALIEMLKKESTNLIKSVKIAQTNEVKRWVSDS